MYKLINNPITNETVGILRIADNATIPLAPANTDYQTFKREVSEGVELQDADGNVMTQEQVDEFLNTLP